MRPSRAASVGDAVIATIEEVKVRYKLDLAQHSEDARIAQALAGALAFVARYTSIPQEPTQYQEMHDGRRDALVLAHGPITDGSTVVVRESLAVPRDWSDASIVSADLYVVDPAAAVVARIDGLLFGATCEPRFARSSVRVDYTAGYDHDDAPDDLRDAALTLCGLAWKGSDYVGISGLRGDDGQITRYGFDSLPRDVADVLDRYRYRRLR